MFGMLLDLFKQAKSPVEYIMAFYIWLLFAVALVGFISLFYLMITEPQVFFDINFGIIDRI